MLRKAKKKIREIEALKKKEHLTEEEKEKINVEDYWNSIIQPKPKPRKILPNKYRITDSLCHQPSSPRKKEEDPECPICFAAFQNSNEKSATDTMTTLIPKEDMITTNCHHIFCKSCVSSVIQHCTRSEIRCSLCRGQIKNYEFHSEESRNEIMDLLASKKITKNKNEIYYF